jgi:deazaflavin-dependent oxidoreductase (nitroreductase family)
VTRFQRIRRAVLLFIWKIINPPSRALAGIAPWWVVIETKGRVSGERRQTPLARGPLEGEAAWLIAVHGRHSAWVKNLEAEPRVRLRLRGRWRDGTAAVVPWDPEVAKRFNLYARTGPATIGIDPAMVRVDLGAPP